MMRRKALAVAIYAVGVPFGAVAAVCLVIGVVIGACALAAMGVYWLCEAVAEGVVPRQPLRTHPSP